MDKQSFQHSTRVFIISRLWLNTALFWWKTCFIRKLSIRLANTSSLGTPWNGIKIIYEYVTFLSEKAFLIQKSIYRRNVAFYWLLVKNLCVIFQVQPQRLQRLSQRGLQGESGQPCTSPVSTAGRLQSHRAAALRPWGPCLLMLFHIRAFLAQVPSLLVPISCKRLSWHLLLEGGRENLRTLWLSTQRFPTPSPSPSHSSHLQGPTKPQKGNDLQISIEPPGPWPICWLQGVKWNKRVRASSSFSLLHILLQWGFTVTFNLAPCCFYQYSDTYTIQLFQG